MENASGPGVGISNTGALISQALNATIFNHMDYDEANHMQQQCLPQQQQQQSQQQQSVLPSSQPPFHQSQPSQQLQTTNSDVNTSPPYISNCCSNNVSTFQTTNLEESSLPSTSNTNTNNSTPSTCFRNDRKRSRTDENLSYSVTTNNRFEILNELNENENNVNNEQNIKIPPIVIHNYKNFHELLKDIKEVVKNDFTTKIISDKVKVNLNTIEDFRNLKSFCTTNNIEFHSFRDPYSKTFNCVIKDMHTIYSEIEIFNELSKSYPVKKVSRLYGKNRAPLPICAVELEDNVKGRSILNLNKFIYSVVKVLPRSNNNKPIQCKNCQRFNHTQANCGLRPRCVRCKGDHHYSKCNIPKNSTTPICVNCGKNHTANWRGCEYYKEILKSKTNNYKSKFTTKNVSQNLQQNAFQYQNSQFPPIRRNMPTTPQDPISNNWFPRNSHNSQNSTATQHPMTNRWFPRNAMHNSPYSNSTQNSINNNWSPNNSMNNFQNSPDITQYITQIITITVNQILSTMLPQIQTLIQNALNNGFKP